MQKIKLRLGDCIDLMRGMEDESVDATISDPPYFLGFMGKEFDSQEGAHKDPKAMQKVHEVWLKEVFRVLKRGSVIKAFSGTRTHHRLCAAMEAVGFVLDKDDSLNAQVYGQGFPKSTNISKSIDRMMGAQRDVVGYKRGVGGENMNDIVRGGAVRDTEDPGGKGVGAYGTGARQVPVDVPVTKAATEEAARFNGYGTALKPSFEPVIVARKP